MKQEILENLRPPKDVKLPDYIRYTILKETNSSGLSDKDIEDGKSKLSKDFDLLKKGVPIKPLYSDQKQYIAYINSYLEIYFPRMHFILNHLLKYTNFYEILKSWNNETIRILDIGTGPGTMFNAFIEYFENINQFGIFNFNYEVNLIEREENFLKFIKELFNIIQTINPALSKRINLKETLEPRFINFKDLKGSLKTILGDEKYNVIILSFIINENNPDKDKLINLFNLISTYLKENGIIILLEAPSPHLYKYLEIDFKSEVNLIRNAPCLNANRNYGTPQKRDFPFFNPCGDLCTFQINPEERNSFCYLVLSSQDINSRNYSNLIQNTIDLYQRNISLTYMNRYKRQKILDRNGRENIDIYGLFTNRSYTDYYFCNGGCKFKIANYSGTDFNFEEGDIVIIRNAKFDGPFVKKNTRVDPPIIKNYAELGFKYGGNDPPIEPSSFEKIPYFLNE